MSTEKWDRDFVVAVYLMDVTEASDDYEEAHYRDRTWWSLTEAATKLGDHPVLPLLARARTRLDLARHREPSRKE